MSKSDSCDEKLSQARVLASQLGMFAEENDIPKDLGMHWRLQFMIFIRFLMKDKLLFREYQLINQGILNKSIKM